MQSSNVAGIKSLPRFRFSDALFEMSSKKSGPTPEGGMATVRFRKGGNKTIIVLFPICALDQHEYKTMSNKRQCLFSRLFEWSFGILR